MFLNQHEMQRYIQTCAKRGGLNVVWQKGAVPHVNSARQIVLPLLDADAQLEDYLKLLHYAVHEVDHELYSDMELPMKNGVTADRSLLGMIWNVLEDHRVEFLGTREFEGDRLNSDTVYPDLLGKVVSTMEWAKANAANPKAKPALAAGPVLALFNEANADMYPSAGAVAGPMVDAVANKDRLDKLMKGDYLDALRRIRTIEDSAKGTAATYELAKRIFKEVYEQDPEKEEKRCQQEKQKQEGKGKGEEGEGQEKGSGKGEGAGEGEEGKEKGEARTKFETVKYSELVPNAHDHAEPEARIAKAGQHIDYTGHRGSERYVPSVASDFRVADFPKNKFDAAELGQDRGGGASIFKSEMSHAMTPGAAGFASRVRTKLQIRSRGRVEYGTKKGKLHRANMYRATMEDCPGFNERIFKRKVDSDTLDTCVQVIVDTSGSMSGEKYVHAAVSAKLLNDAIGNVLGIPLEIVGFTDRYGGGTFKGSDGFAAPIMFIHRDFDTVRLPDDELTRRMGIARNWMSGNPDGDAVAWCYDRIKRRKEKRKVMIVLSDGSPACGKPGDIDWYTKEVVKRIKSEKRVDIVGIGIMDHNVTRYYPEHYVIKGAHELEGALLSLIDKKVR